MFTIAITAVVTLIVLSLKPVRKFFGAQGWAFKEGAQAAYEGREPDITKMPEHLRFGQKS